jgi:phage terminase large subunit
MEPQTTNPNYLPERDDPVTFARQVLRDNPTPMQVELMRACAVRNARVAARGCHSSSKTYAAARIAIWFVTRYEDGIVVTTAPTARQVEDVMWDANIIPAISRARLKYPTPNMTRFSLGPNNYITGFTTSKGAEAVRFQGYKAPHLLFILDEAPGIPDEALGAIEGTGAGDDMRVLMLGNPTFPGGNFHRAFTNQRDIWTTFTFDAYDMPGFAKLHEMCGAAHRDKEYITELLRTLPPNDPAILFKGDPPRPYLANPEWAQRTLKLYGAMSPWWESRARAQFPTQAQDALLSLAWIEAAKNRPAPTCEHIKLAAGIDVAGPGKDECVAQIGCSDCGALVAWQAWASPDPRGECVAFLNPYKPRLETVNVDSTGIGYNFTTHLRDLEFNVAFINVGEAADESEVFGFQEERRFENLKAQLYWQLRDRFQSGSISGLDDETTMSQLSTLKWLITPKGKIAMERKIDMKKRGVASPDRAEALMLAYAQVGPNAMIEVWKEDLEKFRGQALIAPRPCDNANCTQDKGMRKSISVNEAAIDHKGKRYCCSACVPMDWR